MDLARNPNYHDPERPYLDNLVIRTTSDENQRYSTLAAGGLDAMISANAQTTDPAEQAGLTVLREQRNGGNGLMLNTAVAPFDDPRAREAVVLAVDPAGVNGAVTAGKGTLPGTLFRQESPFFADVPLARHDPVAAQALFDRLAAEGKPVRFTMTAYQTAESRLCMEAIQAQLAGYRNVTAEIEVLDFAGAGARLVQRQFQAIGGSIGNFTDPGFPLWNTLRSDRPGNYQGVADPALDAALDAGLSATDPAARKDAYGVVQQRIAELNLYLLYTRSNGGVIVGKDLHGAWLSGNASLQTDALWKAP
jgi:peptide/nickel transport system substrate-binding protein